MECILCLNVHHVSVLETVTYTHKFIAYMRRTNNPQDFTHIKSTPTVLCKSNANETQRITDVVLAKFHANFHAMSSENKGKSSSPKRNTWKHRATFRKVK